MPKKQTLKVVYDSEVVNSKLDNAIKTAVKPFGYKFYASGCNRTEHKRDLAFDKESDGKTS